MPIEVTWDNAEKTIIRHSFDGDWTWDEMHAAMARAYTMMESVPHRVDVILDIEKTGPIPSEAINEINILRKMPRHPHQGKTILAGTNSFLNMIYDFFTRFTAFPNFGMAPSVDAARAMLVAIRE